MTAVRWQEDDLILSIKAQLGASKNEFCGRYGDYIRVRINAIAEGGKANKQLVNFFSKCFRVKKADVEILSGHNQTLKRIVVHNPVQIPEDLRSLIDDQQ